MRIDAEIRRILKEKFDLKENHLLILEHLIEKKNMKIDAETLSKETGVPLGRIYEFLGDLVDYGFLGVQYTRPKYYYLKKPMDAFQTSINILEDELASAEKKMLDYGMRLQKFLDSGDEGIPKIRVLSTKDYHDIAYTLYLSSPIIRAGSTTSYLLWKDQLKDPFKKRLYDVFRKRLDSNQMKAKYMFPTEILKKAKKDAALKVMITNLLKERNIKASFVPNEFFFFCVLSEDESLIRFKSPRDESREKILDIKSREVTMYFNDLFDYIFENGIKLDAKLVNSLE